MTAAEDGGAPLRPGQIPPDIRDYLDSGPDGAEDADAYAGALALVLAVHGGERPRTAPPRVLQALAAVAWGEMVARRMVTGMSEDVARAQAAADTEAWMVAFQLPDLAGE
jgi:hypothetical protein